MTAETPFDGAGEGAPIRVSSIVCKRSGIRLSQLEQPVGDRVDDELVVAVRLLGRLADGPSPRALRVFRLAEEIRVVLGEEVELALDELAEAVAAQPQVSSA